jgi:hypothetical protein
VIVAQPFRFGARVPIRVAEPGKPGAAINYESIGLTINRVSFRENVPTLLGTISLPRTAGTLFIVLTVRRLPE